MDFRPTQPTARPVASSAGSAAPEHKEEKERRPRAPRDSRWMQLLSLVVLVGIAVLLIGIAFSFTRSSGTNESKYVDTSKYQAVFLNNGQVYFGNITSLNDKYVSLKNIYYLTQSGDSSSSNYSLVKLGCQQIHDPTDQMIINRDQVTFWENLNDSGKVVSSINQFKKQNPNGPDCSQVSNQTQATSSNTQATSGSTQNTGSSTTNSSTTNSSTSK